MTHSTRFVDVAMGVPELHPFAHGHVVAFSTPKVGREGPNEDAAAILWTGEDSGILAVADGVGGHPAGAQASAAALSGLLAAIEEAGETADLRGAILGGFDRANQAVMGLGVGAATTMAVAEIASDQVRTYHVGDSSILLLGQRGKQKLLTLAHSPTGYAMEAGLLDEREAMDHEERHLVSNLMGSQEMRIEVGPPCSVSRRDTLLLATDGVFDNLYLEEIVDCIRKGEPLAAAARLAADCKVRMQGNPEGPSKPDDLTFLMFRRDR